MRKTRGKLEPVKGSLVRGVVFVVLGSYLVTAAIMARPLGVALEHVKDTLGAKWKRLKGKRSA